MAQSRGLARLLGWPLVVLAGFGLFSCIGFIWAAIRMRSRRWTVLAAGTSALAVACWTLLIAWTHDGETSAGAMAFWIEMWIAFVVLAWIVSKDYVPGASTSTATAGRAPAASNTGARTLRARTQPMRRPDGAPLPASFAGVPHMRTPAACPVQPGRDIGSYSRAELVGVLAWIASDGTPRTPEQLWAAFMYEMGYAQWDSRIMEAFDGAYYDFQGRSRSS